MTKRNLWKYTLLVALLPLLFSSCHRRDLLEADCMVRVHFLFDYDIVNYTAPGDPELMRVVFYDSESGYKVTEAFLPPTGGDVKVPSDRSYDVVAWNFDTDVTFTKNEDDKSKALATTGSIPESSKTKLRSRGKSTDGQGTKSDELFLYDPDHLFVGRCPGLYIVPLHAGLNVTEITLDCRTVVESWLLKVDKIKGAQYIGNISIVISGLSEYALLGEGKQSDSPATVYFDNGVITHDGLYTAHFNTFGRNASAGHKQVVSLVITDLGGKTYIFNVDVSEQFDDNPEQIIYIHTEEIEIPIPITSTSGGLEPSVDEWKDLHTTIYI